MKKALLFSVFGAVVAAASGATVDFTYTPDPASADYQGYGFSKAETYDAAIRITDPTLVGGRIVAMRVPIPVESDWVDNATAWMSGSLRLENKVNAPDIASVRAEVADRMLTATFTEPYTITDDGVYVGYSFTVTHLGDFSTHPLAYVEGDAPASFYIHSSRTRLKWTDEHESTGYVSAMTVTIQTDSGDYDVAVGLPARSTIVRGKQGPVSLSLVNYGSYPLAEVGYTWSAGNASGEGTLTLGTPLQPGHRSSADIAVGPCPEIGTAALSVTAETFNGIPNGDPRRTASGELDVMPFMPVNRPLVEEYTGLGCGWCPRGYIAMEEMGEKYGDRFVGLAYHSTAYETASMVVMRDAAFPVNVPGFPYGTLNRTLGMDPGEVPEYWDSAAAAVAPADVNVSLEWNESHSTLHAEASLDFAREYDDADMSMAIAIAADGLRNDDWRQHNYYSGEEPGGTGPLWDIFTQGAEYVAGLTFNYVMAWCDNTRGVEGTVPAKITFDTHPSYSVDIPVSGLVNIRNLPFINSGARLYAVAILIDNATGAVLNSNKSAPLTYSTAALGDIGSDAGIVATEWHDLTGRRVPEPRKGMILIRTDRLADGSVRHSKTIHM